MNHKIIKRFNGFSGSKVLLMQDNLGQKFVRKINNTDRNFERLQVLHSDGFRVPKIYSKYNNILDMEFIDGLDIKTYISVNGIDNLVDFLYETICRMSQNSRNKNYSDIYIKKLSEINFEHLPFTMNDLIDRLPVILPQSNYHGDLTLENIIYSKTNQFYMIDAVTIDYDSWVFDIAKMRQDLHCGWFIRNNKDNNLITFANMIQDKLLNYFPIANDDNLLILMLLRVYKHCESLSSEYYFLLKEINKLWK